MSPYLPRPERWWGPSSSRASTRRPCAPGGSESVSQARAGLSLRAGEERGVEPRGPLRVDLGPRVDDGAPEQVVAEAEPEGGGNGGGVSVEVAGLVEDDRPGAEFFLLDLVSAPTAPRATLR